jgi:hypothetical protein
MTKRAARIGTGIALTALLGAAWAVAHGRWTAAGRAARPAAPAARFVDVTHAAGIRFRHENGAFGRKWLPETMGSGCAFLDYDGDGRLDVLFVNGMPLRGGSRLPAPGSPRTPALTSLSQNWERGGRVRRSVRLPLSQNWERGLGGEDGLPEEGTGGVGPTMALYRNTGDGTFREVTREAGLAVPMYGMGCAVGDYDNDGHDDLLLTTLDGCRLFRNEGGRRFREVTREAGIGGTGWATGAAWVDVDRDGWLDLFVCHYVRWSPERDVYGSLDGIHKSYTTPEKYHGETCRLFRNEGKGRFREVTRAAGIYSTQSKAMGVAVCDVDGDGWPDLAVSNDTEPNFLFHNQGDMTFKEIAAERGIAVSEEGRARAGMGIDAGDETNTGQPSILITNFSGEQPTLYRHNEYGLFLDHSARSGIGTASQLYLGFGAFFFDYDLDGWLDVFIANGHVMDDIEVRNTGVTYRQPALLFRSSGDGRFVEVGRESGTAIPQPQVGRGAAWGDWDDDGDPDLLLSANGGEGRLLRNDTPSGNGWLRLLLEGRASNRNGIGARVTVRVGNRTFMQCVKSGSSYLSESDRRLTFGLGRATHADEIEILWPSGAVQTLGRTARNQVLRITEGEP